MVRSEGVALYESRELKKLMRRIDKNCSYYKTNTLIHGTFKFLGLEELPELQAETGNKKIS